jgi:hypothetical protein
MLFSEIFSEKAGQNPCKIAFHMVLCTRYCSAVNFHGGGYMLITHYPDSPLHRNGCFKTAAPRRMAHQDARMSEIQEEKTWMHSNSLLSPA